MLVHLDIVCVKFKGQGHRSRFMVTRGNAATSCEDSLVTSVCIVHVTTSEWVCLGSRDLYSQYRVSG